MYYPGYDLTRSDSFYRVPDRERMLDALRAVQANPSPTVRLDQAIIRPASDAMAVQPVGGNRLVFLRDDPVLRAFARYPDEREFEAMQASDAVSTPIASVVRSLLGYGWSVEVPADRKGSDQAKLYRDFCWSILSNSAGFEVTLQQMCRATFNGWGPFQCIWEPFVWRGQLKTKISQVVDQKPHHYSFTTDTRSLVFMGDGFTPAQIFEGRLEREWAIVRTGSLYSPFGRSPLSSLWFTWDVLKRFEAWYETGARNALQGVPVVSETGTGLANPNATPGDRTAVSARLVQRITEIMRIYREVGALALGADIKFEELKSIETVTGWIAAIDRYERKLQRGIQGEELSSLSSGPSGSGSRALGEIHNATKMDNVRAVGRAVAPTLTQILHRLVEINFPNPDLEDFPVFRFEVENFIDRDNLAAFIAAGGAVDPAPIAEQWNIPMPELLEGEQRPPLRRQAPQLDLSTLMASGIVKPPQNGPGGGNTPPAAPPAPAGPPRPALPPAGGRRSEASLPAEVAQQGEDADQVADQVADDAGTAVEAAFRAYAGIFSSLMLRVDPEDPSPKA